jgi:uncharacterized zinc-type alcohol dehydrogenase-like protein
VYTPLAKYIKTHGARVGVVGVGGLGHLAVRIAKAMGAWVAAFDPVADKGGAAGADAFNDDSVRGLDLILTTTSAELDWNEWMGRLALGGTLCLLGVPRGSVTVHPDHLLDGMKAVTGSVIGTPAAMKDLLALAVAKGIRPVTEVLPLRDAQKGVERVRSGKARYRVVLTAGPT